MGDTQINLIHKHVGSLHALSSIEEKVRTASWWALGILLAVGVSVMAGYLLLSTQIKNLESRKLDFARRINAESSKEALLLSLKERVGIAGKALSVAKPWGKIFPVLVQISDAGGFNSLAVEENGRVSTDMTLSSIDQAVLVANNLIALTNERVIRTPQLLTFQLRDNGDVHMSISFYPIF